MERRVKEKKRKKICMIGHFAFGVKRYDGQTVKTLAIYNQLVNKYGKSAIGVIDTYNWKRKPMKFMRRCVVYTKSASDVIIMPASRGAKVFVPLFTFLKKKYDFKLHYILIGGKIYTHVESNRFFRKCMRRVDYIYAENNNVIKRLKRDGVDNVLYMPNFKDLIPSKREKVFIDNNILKCCIFQRLEENKGVIDVIDVVNKYNEKNKKKISLDIYGKIKPDFEVVFDDLLRKSKFVKYCGVVEPEKSVSVVEQYDLLVFPTKCADEGIPGTIIDAFFAGTPVLASKWNNFKEIIDEGKTGFGYEFNDVKDFYDKIKGIADNKKILVKMSKNCIDKADSFTADKAMVILYRNITFERSETW